MPNLLESLGRADVGGEGIRLRDALEQNRANKRAAAQDIRAGETQAANIESTRVSTERTRNLADEEARLAAKGRQRILTSDLRNNMKAANPFASKPVLDAMEAQARTQGIIAGEGEGAYVLREDIAPFLQSRLTPSNVLKDIQAAKKDFETQKTQATAALEKYRQDNPNKNKEDLAKDKNYTTLLEAEKTASAGLTHYLNAEASATGAVEQERALALARAKKTERPQGKLGKTYDALVKMNNTLPENKQMNVQELRESALNLADLSGANAEARDLAAKSYVAVMGIDGGQAAAEEAYRSAIGVSERVRRGEETELSSEELTASFKADIKKKFPGKEYFMGERRDDGRYTIIDVEGNPVKGKTGKPFTWGTK